QQYKTNQRHTHSLPSCCSVVVSVSEKVRDSIPANITNYTQQWCCGGVVTQAHGQPDNPVSHWVKMEKNPPYLPPRHFADCHNRKRTITVDLTQTW
ncbi:hypothetical protein ACK83N_004927, partial [Salmonella enterica]